MKLLFCCLLALSSWTFTPIAATNLSASTLLSLCPSDGLVLTCTSNTSFLQWRITDAQGISDTRKVAYDITSYRALSIGTMEFHFSLSSQPSTLPHISQIQADRVTNGTMISCSVSTQGIIQDTQSTTICIIGSGCGPQIIAPEVNVTEQPESFGVVTTVEWIPRMNSSYNISVFPEISPIFTGGTSVQLTIPYNIQITMNVSATLCGEEVITMKHFFYATCGHPLRHTTLPINDSGSVHVLGYNIPVGEGTVVSFSCLDSQLVLTGPNSSRCMRNGEWEPDPRQVACKVNCGVPNITINNYPDITIIHYNGTLEGSLLLYAIKCNTEIVSSTSVCQRLNGTWTPDPREYVCLTSSTSTMSSDVVEQSSVLIALVSSTSISVGLVSIFILVFGLLCGQYLWKKTRTPINQQLPQLPEDKKSQDMASDPIYEDLDAHIGYEEKMNVELKSNISYGPLLLVDSIQKS